MVREGDKCRYRLEGEKELLENASSTVLVIEVNDNEATVLSKMGERSHTFNVKIYNLDPGEYAWRSIAEWIWNKGRGFGESAYYCSKCGNGSDTGYDNYCSECGAKMRR